jgi:metallophosphoesterase (TIGR03768 family)
MADGGNRPRGAQARRDKRPNRRAFLQSSTAVLAAASIGATGTPPASANGARRYPIETPAVTSRERMLAFPESRSPGLAKTELNQVPRYAEFGYGEWSYGAGLPVVDRLDLMPRGHAGTEGAGTTRLLRFFSFTDVHITDEEAPNQLMLFQQIEPHAAANTSIYSPVMLYSTQVLDAAVQTVNDLHRQDPVDFGIMLGDASNSAAFNETRWYIDILDGKVISPSSGAHVGADRVDFQMPFQAAGLDKGIPWYQVLGNHDHFLIGSFPFDAHPALGFREAYTADRVWAVGNALQPDISRFPPIFDYRKLASEPAVFPGVIDGASPHGEIIHAGRADAPVFAGEAPRIAPDAARRPLLRSQWLDQFFDTTTNPVGHGFNLINRSSGDRADTTFACYSFLPRLGVPLKIIVLDVSQSDEDGSTDIHGHGYLDARRLAWLRAELVRGQAENQLMIIASHIPIGVSAIGSKMEWWAGDANTKPGFHNAIDLAGLVETLQDAPNLLLWIAGHRHMNTVKAFPSTDASRPERGFWQVETSSLRDFPQQFRTFEVHLHSDHTVSIEAVNVDIAVAAGTPAAQSRKYAIAAQQIIRNDVRSNNPNFATAGGRGTIPIPSMDPTRPQSDDPSATDPSIQFPDLSSADKPVPFHASCNVRLRKTLSPSMVRYFTQHPPLAR